MVTKIKPRRIKSDNPGSLGDFLGYQDEITFKRGEGGGLYTAGEGIEIGTVQDYSAMRGPCPSGFHVPSKDEWVALCGILTTTFGLASNGVTMKTYLKIPFTGYRDKSSSDTTGQSSYDFYWSSTTFANNLAYIFFANSTTLDIQASFGRSYGLSIRSFKDISIAPDSSWTILYDGSSIATGAGIFHNTALGLISISGDGQNWITISDKNVGATTVYNDGDTLSEANCGGYFQWGNNYMFPFTGSVTTSSTQVDTTGYGPGNYYSSSTFITVDSSDRSSVQNDNLRGGVTGVVTLENAITNTGVLSVNGQTGDVIIEASEASSITTTQPSNPIEGGVYYDTTNDVVKVYDGTNWNIVGDYTADINTKTFYLSSSSDLTTAQAVYEWYKSGKNAIVVYEPDVNEGNRVSGIYVPADNQGSIANVLTLVSTRDGREQGLPGFNEGGGLYRYSLNLNISNSTVTSISKDRKSIADFLSTTETNRAYTPTNDYHPATKKYVDDNDTYIGSSAPSNPVEGRLWYDTTNDVLKSYDGTNWNIVGDDAADINTKTFYLSTSSDLTNAQAAYEWIYSGKNAIINYSNKVYTYIKVNDDGAYTFYSYTDKVDDNLGGSSIIRYSKLFLNVSGGNVTSVTTGYEQLGKYLGTNVDYTTPYTPLYNGSPTTKKYVDDRDTYIGSSAPTSNLVEGRLWYDTTNDVLKSYDGTNRNNIDTKVTVEDNLTSTSTTNALSANQGRILNGKIADLMALGRFLSLWDATTGLPISFPLTTPYTYLTGDYYLVETVSTATPPVNYRPTGSSFDGTTASTTPETDELEVGDVYIYDGTTWLLQSNHGKTVTFANIAGQPTDNTNLATALGNKQDTLTLPSTPTSGHLVTWGGDNKTLADGGVIPTGVPAVGTNGQVLTVVSGAAAWANAPATGIQNDTTGTTTTVTAIRAGTEQEYALITPNANTIYHIY